MTKKNGYTAGAVIALLVVLGCAEKAIDSAAEAQAKQAPMFEVDPLWPKPLPNHWLLGSAIGVGRAQIGIGQHLVDVVGGPVAVEQPVRSVGEPDDVEAVGRTETLQRIGERSGTVGILVVVVADPRRRDRRGGGILSSRLPVQARPGLCQLQRRLPTGLDSHRDRGTNRAVLRLFGTHRR